MFDLHAIDLKNFRSYLGEHNFEFPTEPGLYFLTGKNLLDEKLGSNGAGKSTLLDAIYWCLYGKTLRGLRGNDVISWGKKACRVSLDLTVGGGRMLIQRTQSPNALEVDVGEGMHPITQEDLQKLIRLSPEAFTYTVILPQFGQSFFERSPTDKLGIFSQILDLDFWLEKSKEATFVSDSVKTEINKLTSDTNIKKQLVEIINEEIEDLSIKANEFTAEQKRAATVLINQLSILEAKENETADEIELYGTTTRALTGEAKKYEEKLSRFEKKRAVYLADTEEMKVRLAIIKNNSENSQKLLAKFEKLGGTCPHCYQRIDAKHVAKERAALIESETANKAVIEDLNAQLSDARKFGDALTADIFSVNSELKKIERKQEKAISELSIHKAAVQAMQRSQEDLRKRIEAERKRPNPYTGMIEAKRAELIKQRSELKEVADLLNSFNAEYTATSFWVNGFKRVRLFLIEETLKTFEIEVNSNLTALGLQNWSVLFDVERENKSGGITKGFTVMVNSPDSPQGTRYESWSGGESQRLQMAGDLGLANLAMTQAGLNGTIEFYDEPSQHLSQEGLLDLAEMLQQRALASGKRVFLIDHNTIEYGGFAGIYTVTKSEKGSSIQ